MKILIVALNSKFIHSALAPRYLQAEVPHAEVMERTVNENTDLILEDILCRKPTLLAFSVYIWNAETVLTLCKKVKELLPDTLILLGGPEVSYNPADTLARYGADYVISGEGEIPFRMLCEQIEKGTEGKIPGVSHGNVTASPYIGTGTPKSPYSEEYLKTLKNRIAYFESSRGCPYSCAYCLSGRCEGMRFFDMDYVKDNLVKLANSGTNTVKFVDRTFNADKRRALEILEFIAENSGKAFPRRVCFHFELSGDLLDGETLELIKNSPPGLFQFEIGIQSFNENTIKAIHRKTDSALLKERIRQLVATDKAHIHTDLIAGLPHEDLESFKNSFDEAYALGADMLQLGFLKILHGTEMKKKAAEYGIKYSPLPPYEVTETAAITGEELKKLKITESAVDKLHNSGKFRRVLSLCTPLYERSYDAFFDMGSVIGELRGLDEITDRLYLYLREKFPQIAEELRDAFVCDRLATNPARGMPPSLCRSDSRLALIKKRLNADKATAEIPHVRRAVAILYHADKAVYADYSQKNRRGEYELKYVDITLGIYTAIRRK